MRVLGWTRGGRRLHRSRWLDLRTWQVWDGLFNPPEDSPVFQRVLRKTYSLPPELAKANDLLRPFGELMLPVVRLLAAVFALALLPAISNLIGLVFAYYVAVFLKRERERGTYDLLSLTPAGEWDTAWTICLACVYRFRVLWHVNFLRVMAVLGILLIAFPLITVHGAGVGALITALIALPLDAIQTIVTGCLCGLLAQSYAGSTANTGMSAAALFIGAQLMCVYAPALLLYRLLVAVQGAGFDSYGVIGPMISLAAAIIFHEVVIHVLWTTLRRRLQ